MKYTAGSYQTQPTKIVHVVDNVSHILIRVTDIDTDLNEVTMIKYPLETKGDEIQTFTLKFERIELVWNEYKQIEWARCYGRVQ